MTPIPPCLAFYLRHATEVENLIELRDAGKLKLGDDTSLFDDVYARASFDASLLVQRLLAAGITAAEAGPLTQPKAKSSNLDHNMACREAYKNLAYQGTPTEVFLDVVILLAGNAVWVVPGIGCDEKAGLAPIRSRLVKSGVIVDEPPWWKETGYVALLPLAILALRPDVGVEDLEAGCRRAFEVLRPHLRAIVEHAAKAN